MPELQPTVLAERVHAGERDLLVLVRLHARYADSADAFVLVHDRQRALDQHCLLYTSRCV